MHDKQRAQRVGDGAEASLARERLRDALETRRDERMRRALKLRSRADDKLITPYGVE